MAELPTPVETEERIAFGISWFATEEEAMVFHRYVRERGLRYNGGWFDGMPCGRDPGFDGTDKEGHRTYAVTR